MRFCPFTKGVQFGLLGRISFNVPLADHMVVSHDEEQNGAFQPLSFVKLQLRNRNLIGIALWVNRGLAILATDDSDICCRIRDHLERRVNHIDIRLCRVVFHRDIAKPLALDRFDKCRPMLLQIRKGAGDHDALVLARRLLIVRHHAPRGIRQNSKIQRSGHVLEQPVVMLFA